MNGNLGNLLGTVLIAGVALKMSEHLFQRQKEHIHKAHKKKLRRIV
jgi:hypothetical protein